MKKPELTKEENEIYSKIIAGGAIDDMFDYGYLIGRERIIKEMMESLKIEYKIEYEKKNNQN